MNRNSLNLALRQTARKLSVPLELVEQVYQSYWCFIRETASGIPIKTVTEEEARQMTTNFNIPYIGKLYINYERIKKYHNQLNFYENVRNKESKTNGKSGTGE